MRLRVSTERREQLETVLRAVAFLALAALFAHSLLARRSATLRQAEGAQINESLAKLSTRENPGRVHVVFDPAPTPIQRDWLAAIARAGSTVTWAGVAPAAMAVTVEPVPDPQQRARVWVSAPARSKLVLHDDLGALDTARVERLGARIILPHLNGKLRVTAARGAATTAMRDSLLLRPVLVLGEAGWESKFLLAALEEQGWQVDARLAVAPSGDVQQGTVISIDTARYAAVIAVDSVVNRYAQQIARYVRAGGGLIASGEAARASGLSTIVPAVVLGAPSMPALFSKEKPRSALALARLDMLKEGAYILETKPPGTEIAAAAWRVGRGRVIQIGYHDTWRWRLAGAEPDAPHAHRAWWAGIVSAVAYAPRFTVQVTEPLEPTPLASLVATLGAPAHEQVASGGLLADPRIVSALFALLLAALILEWASRRLRGAP